MSEERSASYAPPEDVPLGSFAVLMGVYISVLGVVGLVGRARGVRLPERISFYDLVCGGIAAHKISRTLSKASIASPIRAPFVTFEEVGGPGEFNESARGHGMRKAIGELLACPFCIGQWISTALVVGFVFKPRQTRFISSIFVVKTGSDLLQFVHTRLHEA